MGRPPTLLTDVRDFHAHLLTMGLAGVRIPRQQWDQAVAQTMQCSPAKVRHATESGRQHGLWDVVPGGGPGRHGYVTLRGNASVPAAPSPQEASPLVG